MERALEGSTAAGAQTRLLDLRELALPLYNLDDDEPGKAAANLIESCYAADGLIWSSPLYQGTISGALKNALDWLHVLGRRATSSRPKAARRRKRLRRMAEASEPPCLTDVSMTVTVLETAEALSDALEDTLAERVASAIPRRAAARASALRGMRRNTAGRGRHLAHIPLHPAHIPREAAGTSRTAPRIPAANRRLSPGLHLQSRQRAPGMEPFMEPHVQNGVV